MDKILKDAVEKFQHSERLLGSFDEEIEQFKQSLKNINQEMKGQREILETGSDLLENTNHQVKEIQRIANFSMSLKKDSKRIFVNPPN